MIRISNFSEDSADLICGWTFQEKELVIEGYSAGLAGCNGLHQLAQDRASP